MNRVNDVISNEVQKMAHGVFVLRLILTIGAYAGVTFWLNAIRQTSAIWFVWVLIAVQLVLFLSIFVVCSMRARVCAFRHTWLLFIPLVLSRVNDWEVVVIPVMAVAMCVLSARSRNVSIEYQHLPLSDADEKKQVLAKPESKDDEFRGYELLSKELESGKRDAVLWLKSFSESDGNEAKAQAAYNRARASTLAKEFSAKQQAEEQSRREKVEAAERAERMEREACENERKAKADAAEAEQKRFIGAVNGLLGICPEHSNKLPSRETLYSTLAELEKVLPQLLVMGMDELAGKVRDCQVRLSELLVTHTEHRTALERALPLVAAKKIAPIREMMNHALEGRFEDLDYTPFQALIDKAHQRFFNRFVTAAILLFAVLIGFGIYNSMVEAKRRVVPDEKSVMSPPATDLASDGMGKEVDTPPPHLSTTPANQPPLDPFLGYSTPTFQPPMAPPNREPEAVGKLETPTPPPAVPPTSPAPIDSSNGQVTTSVDLSRTVRIIKLKRGDSLSVRSGPGTSFQIIGEIPAHATGIRLLGHGQGKPVPWVPVVWKDILGWVNGSFLDYE